MTKPHNRSLKLLGAACLALICSPLDAQILGPTGGPLGPTGPTDPTGGGGATTTVDPIQTTVMASETRIVTNTGTTTITVMPRTSTGVSAGAGLSVRILASGGTLLGSVQDQGDGRYTQVLQAGPLGALVICSAEVGGVAMMMSAPVQFVPFSPSQSTVAVSPGEIGVGETAQITVVPKDDSGANLGAGLPVMIRSSAGTLLGSVVDNADGSYSQSIQMDAAGTALIQASLLGVDVEESASLAASEPVLGKVVGMTAGGNHILYESIQQAVDRGKADGVDHIMVAPGAFEERVLIKCRRGLTIQAMPEMGVTSVRGFVIYGSKDITIKGFAIERGKRCKRAIKVMRSKRVKLEQMMVMGEAELMGKKAIWVGPWSRDIVLNEVAVESRFRRFLKRLRRCWRRR